VRFSSSLRVTGKDIRAEQPKAQACFWVEFTQLRTTRRAVWPGSRRANGCPYFYDMLLKRFSVGNRGSGGSGS